MLQKYLAISAFLYKFSMPSYVCRHCRLRHGLFYRPSYALAHCLVGVDIYVLDLPLPMCAIIGLILQNLHTLSQNYTTT